MKVVTNFAAFTDLPVREKPTVCAVRPKIMNHLHNGNFELVQRVVQGWGDQWIHIVHESGIWAEGANSGPQLLLGAEREEGVLGESELIPDAVLLDFIVMARIREDLVPLCFQKRSFGYSGRVFSSELLVKVVNEEDLHFTSSTGLETNLRARARVSFATTCFVLRRKNSAQPKTARK